MTNAFSLRGLPLFLAFFLWSWGTGSMQLARPLFASSFGVSEFFVTLVIASNSLAHLVAGPLTGIAMDRWGRRPLLMVGLLLRGTTALIEFFTGSYVEFLLLEFVGGMGVSMWSTGSAVLIADVSGVENRGRVVAARSVSIRLGFILGPIVGALIASWFDLRAIFLFNAVTKFAIVFIVLWLVRETRPEVVVPSQGAPTLGEGLSVKLFLSRSFLAIALVSVAVSMMSQGVVQSLMPLHLKSLPGFTTGDVGILLTVAAAATLLVSIPNGYIVDFRGRKITLVPGLVVIGLSALMLSSVDGHLGALLMVIVYGLGDGICSGASQAYAMDLAPEQRRGAFLGVWTLVSNAGGSIAPLLVGLSAQYFGFQNTFVGVAGVFVLVALYMGVFGPDTRPKHRQALATAA